MTGTFSLWDLFREGLVVVKGLPGAGKTLSVAKAVSQFRKAYSYYDGGVGGLHAGEPSAYTGAYRGVTCITKELILRFYAESSLYWRTLVYYRLMAAFGKPLDYYIMEEPWRLYQVLEKALGRHNAELTLHILSHWLSRNGCPTTPEELKKILSDEIYWK